MRRIANDPCVTLAPCTSSGKVIGPTVEGVARRMEGQEAENALRRASLWSRTWMLLYKVLASGDRWIPYEVIRPKEDAGSDLGTTNSPGPYVKEQREEVSAAGSFAAYSEYR